jgi:uncharacterized membrane protein
LFRVEGVLQMSPILALHICAGTVGLLSGAVAASFRKGSPRHAMAGKVFVISMVSLGASAMYLAVRKHEVGNFIGGLLTIYLVTTAWLTARRRDGLTSIFDWAALLIPLGVAISTLTLGFQKLLNPAAFHDGVPVGMNFFMGTVVLFAAAGDVRMIIHGLSGTQRIARHLWRMCFGLFFASGSIFIARPHLFPAWLSTTHILLFLGVLPLILMIFWLIRVRFTNAFKGPKSPDRTIELRAELRAHSLPV